MNPKTNIAKIGKGKRNERRGKTKFSPGAIAQAHPYIVKTYQKPSAAGKGK